MKTLAVFDFDDTLFKSECCVVVKRKSGKTIKLSTHEYAMFSANPGDKFDFSEFERYPVNPKPIKENVSKMVELVRVLGIDNVMILTARGQAEPVEQVLRDFGLPSVFVAAVDSTLPEAKAQFVEMTVSTEGYDQVILFEDNSKNIFKIAESVLKMLGPGSIVCHLVGSDGKSQALKF